MRPQETPPADLMNTQALRLLSGMSLHSDRHLAEVEQDLVQMDVLLDEAIKKLCASFMAIHQAVALQQEALNGMHAAGDDAARFAAIQAEIDCHIGAAVTGLQFQDMTSQLIRRMALHLAGLRDVFGALNTSTNGSPVLPESGSDEILAMLDQIGDQVGGRCIERSGGARSTVNQRHMESGDVELF